MTHYIWTLNKNNNDHDPDKKRIIAKSNKTRKPFRNQLKRQNFNEPAINFTSLLWFGSILKAKVEYEWMPFPGMEV